MTTLKKTVITATLAAAIGVSIYEAQQISHLRQEIQTLHEQQAPLTTELFRKLQSQRDEALKQLAEINENNAQ